VSPNEDSCSSSDRLSREAEFHDRLYSAATREAAGKYYAVVRRSRDAYRRILLEHAARRERILEYGCGEGSYALDLAAVGAYVTGIDISTVAIDKSIGEARKRGLSERAEFVVMNAEATTFADNSFDLVCGTGILHHLNLANSYWEIARVLKPTGRAVFVEPLGHNPVINWYRRRTPAMRTPDEHPLLMSDLRLASRYFRRVDLDFNHFLSLLTVPLRNSYFFEPACALASGIDGLLMKMIPPFRRWAWTVTMIMTK
jgi:SAM-dependent methyltransferase